MTTEGITAKEFVLQKIPNAYLHVYKTKQNNQTIYQVYSQYPNGLVSSGLSEDYVWRVAQWSISKGFVKNIL